MEMREVLTWVPGADSGAPNSEAVVSAVPHVVLFAHCGFQLDAHICYFSLVCVGGIKMPRLGLLGAQA